MKRNEYFNEYRATIGNHNSTKHTTAWRFISSPNWTHQNIYKTSVKIKKHSMIRKETSITTLLCFTSSWLCMTICKYVNHPKASRVDFSVMKQLVSINQLWYVASLLLNKNERKIEITKQSKSLGSQQVNLKYEQQNNVE